jgi:type IV pilus assembly protein PilQ
MKKNKATVILSIMALSVLLVFGLTCRGQAMEESPAAASNVITGISMTDKGVEIKASRPFIYTIYKPADPYRVVVEIPDADISAFKQVIKAGIAGITEITPSHIDSPRRAAKIEILLQSPSGIDSSYHNNVLLLTVKKDIAETMAGASKTEPKSVDVKPVPAQQMEEESAAQAATELTGISFDRIDGVVKVLVSGNGSMNPSVFTLKNKIVMDIPDVAVKTDVPSEMMYPVKTIRIGNHDDKTRLVIDLDKPEDFDVSSVENTVVVALKTMDSVLDTPQKDAPQEVQKSDEEAMSTKEPDALVEGKYTGKKISLDFQDSDIVPIFRLLADISGYNMVVDPNVKGRLTMKLINVPWDQALELILKTFALGKSVEGNIIRIAPLSVLARENEEKIREREARTKSEPLVTKIYPISYADVHGVEKAIKDSKILSTRGSLSVDTRTSTMTINDIQSVQAQVEKLLVTLDKQTPQVMIEARIVEVNTTDEKDLGIQWGLKLSAANTLSSFGGLSTLGKGTFTGNSFLVDVPSGSAGAGSGSGFTFGILSPDRTFGLDLQLSALQKIGRTKIISNPRVVTVDNKPATIMQGTSEPFPKLTTEGTISTDFKDVVLSTEVTPHITPAGSISMVVNIKKEDILGTVNIGGSQVPRTSKIEGKTNVLIQNGETIVIGGVYKKTENYSSSGVPWLMNIPVLGWLFKNEHPSEAVTELLIFLTPRIVQEQ